MADTILLRTAFSKFLINIRGIRFGIMIEAEATGAPADEGG